MPNIYAFTEGPAQELAALSSQGGLQLPTSQSQSPPPNTHTPKHTHICAHLLETEP